MNSLLPRNTPTPQRSDQVQGTLNKSVNALAIEPTKMALTLNGRKAYNVMLWLAQRMKCDAEGGYSSAVSAIVKGYGGPTKHAARLQRYIEQMAQTTVIWRPLGTSRQASLIPGDGPDPEVTQEVRTFPLLAEARTYSNKNGHAWVTWFYPPSIREQLVNPDRWAQLELGSIARLSTYTAVALYEICARYKNSPGGLTSRHEASFWVGVLREGGGSKSREYRKFKSEHLRAAIAEINACTEIVIELIERNERHEGGITKYVQFRVAVQSRNIPQPIEAVDVSLAMQASALGVKETELDALITAHGTSAVEQGLQALEAQVNRADAAPIHNRAAYLRQIVQNRPGAAPTAPPSCVLDTPLPRTLPTASAPLGSQAADATQDRRVTRLKEIAQEFADLPPQERDAFLDNYIAQKMASGSILMPAMLKHLQDRNWKAPLVRASVLGAFAEHKYGPKWADAEPSDAQGAAGGDR